MDDLTAVLGAVKSPTDRDGNTETWQKIDGFHMLHGRMAKKYRASKFTVKMIR